MILEITDDKLKQWLDEEIRLRRALANHSTVDEYNISNSIDVGELLIYDVELTSRLAYITANELVKKETPYATQFHSHTVSFVYDGVEIYSFCGEKERIK